MKADDHDRPRPVCIAGMHRSGTSMTARLLNLCGLYLGSEDEMLPPQNDNPRGFWELKSFVDVNENVLSCLGGAWDRLPAVPASAALTDPDLAPARLQALELAAAFRGREPWGFKDPRNSLTLAFWRDVLGPLDVVICLRNPRDVVRSLTARGSRVENAYRLWEAHYRALLDTMGDGRSIVVHYESFFEAPVATLERLCRFVGLDVGDAAIRAACGSIEVDLRNHHSDERALADSAAPVSVVELYAELCRRAGRAPAGGATTAADVLAVRLRRVEDRLAEAVERLSRTRDELAAARTNAEGLKRQVLGWRALAERGEPVQRAWRTLTLLMAEGDPRRTLERHGADLVDDALREAVRLYEASARDEGQDDVAADLEKLARSIDAMGSTGRPVAATAGAEKD